MGVEPAYRDDQADRQTGKTVLKFWISDTGCGIAADMLPNLFESFSCKVVSVDSGEKAIKALNRGRRRRTLSTGATGLENARNGRH